MIFKKYNILLHYLLVMFIVFIPSQVFSQTPEVKKIKIIIFNFNDESELPNYRYYSHIIPNSLASDLKDFEEYEIQVLPIAYPYISDEMTQEEKEKYLLELVDKGNKYNTKILVLGSYKVDDDYINIKTQIYNTFSDQLIDAVSTKEKIGALVYELIAKITKNINIELKNIIDKENEKIASSPFIKIPNALKNIYFGYSYNYMLIKGKWEDLYFNKPMSTIFIGFPVSKIFNSNSIILKNLYIIPSWHLFSTNNIKKQINTNNVSYMDIYIPSIAITYQYPLISFAYIVISCEGGWAMSKITYPLATQNEPFSENLLFKSNDPYASTEIGVLTFFYNIGFKGTVSYNRIFYLGNDFYAYGINLSMLYRL